MVWTIGVIIFILMMATGFLGYVLPYGQMSLWGEFSCPTWSYYDMLNLSILPLNKAKTRSIQRIGPHNIDIINIIYGSLLGDGFAEKHGQGTRICFQQEHHNNAYLLHFHELISNLGYCNLNKPKILQRLGSKGKIRQLSRFKTFTFSSFDWIRETFYVKTDAGIKSKIVPSNIAYYLSPLSLAIWIMDDGSSVSSGMKIATNCFKLKEVEMLCNILNQKFNIEAKPHCAGLTNQYNIYIASHSMPVLANIVKTHIHPSMKYKFNGHL